MARAKRVPLNRLVKPETFDSVKMLAEAMECSEGEVVDRAVVAYEGTRGGVQVSEAARVALRWWAKQDGVMDAEIVERAIAMYDDARASGGEVAGVSGIPASSGSPSGRVPEAFVGAPQGAGYQPCRHCGLTEQIHPKTTPWWACPGCQREGHGNFPDCRKCARRDHAQGLAAKSTAADTSNIDFDPEW